jgi:serine/threonine protein kinase
MQPDRWKLIEETFHAAMEQPAEKRSDHLDAVCGEDSELRLEVGRLLDEAALTDGFMEEQAGGLPLSAVDLYPEPSLEGRVLNHYIIGPLVGSGGMADVYRARDTRLERDVAIKILHTDQLLDRQQLEPTLREARVLASLNHPNIASIYGIEEAPGLCGLVLEFVEGEALSERINHRPFTIPETLTIAKQILAGLQAAHAKRIIHRDIKPANIKMTPDGTIKIVDFGLAKLLSSFNTSTSVSETSGARTVPGTLAYMSPEQVRGKDIDARTDVWAFGCVLYEMLVGDPAFRGHAYTDVIVKIATEEPEWNALSRLQGGPSPGLERVMRKCLQKSPEARYQSVREIAGDLEALDRDSASPQIDERSETPVSDADFVLPGHWAFPLFLVAQLGYVALYTVALSYIEAIAKILAVDFFVPERAAFIGTGLLAMCGFAVRIYLISAVGWRHPAAGRKFTILFPYLLLLDGVWATAPLLLWHRMGWLALMCVVMLAYLPFAQRTLMRTIYRKQVQNVQTASSKQS